MSLIKMFTPLYVFTFAILTFSIVGCSPTPSSCSECFEANYDGAIRVFNIKKKNGVKINNNGIETYIIYFSCKIQFIRDYKVRTPAFTMGEFSKGDIFEIGSAHAEFIKTDNGWQCSGVDYDIIHDCYYINKKGKKLNYFEYAGLKAGKRGQEPKIFTGRIDKIMPHAALSLRKVGCNISALLYDKELKQTTSLKGYLSGDKWVLKLNDKSWIEGKRGLHEGEVYDENGYAGTFSFRQVSFNWEQVKMFDTPVHVNSVDSKKKVYVIEGDTPTYFTIVSDTAYYYTTEQGNIRTGLYVLNGNIISTYLIRDSLAYVEYSTKGEEPSRGWLKLSDFAID